MAHAEELAQLGIKLAKVQPRAQPIAQTLLVVRDPQQPVVARLKDLQAQYPGSEIKVTACERTELTRTPIRQARRPPTCAGARAVRRVRGLARRRPVLPGLRRGARDAAGRVRAAARPSCSRVRRGRRRLRALRPLADGRRRRRRRRGQAAVRAAAARGAAASARGWSTAIAARAASAIELKLDTLAHDERRAPPVRRLGFAHCSPYYHNPLPGAVYMAWRVVPDPPAAQLRRDRRPTWRALEALDGARRRDRDAGRRHVRRLSRDRVEGVRARRRADGACHHGGGLVEPRLGRPRLRPVVGSGDPGRRRACARWRASTCRHSTRLFLRGSRAALEVSQYARVQFLERQLFATPRARRSCVLVSLLERRVGHPGRYRACGRVSVAAEWDAVIARMALDAALGATSRAALLAGPRRRSTSCSRGKEHPRGAATRLRRSPRRGAGP